MDASVRTAASAAPVVTIGANFEGLGDSGGGVPDSNGAVGPAHFVELVNIGYRVYDKAGAIVQEFTSSATSDGLEDFWSAAGIDPNDAVDPRVLYDHDSGRWFAAAVDGADTPDSRFLLAVSETSDPTQGWQAVAIRADPSGQSWADFTMLGVNEDGVYLSANMLQVLGATGGPNFTPVVVIPKSDLLQPVPSVINATALSTDPSSLGFAAQPAVAVGTSGPEPLLSASGTGQGLLKLSLVEGPIGNPTLNTADRFISVLPATNPPFAVQEGTTTLIVSAMDTRFGSSVVLQGGRLFGVQTIEDGGHSALRWFEIGDPSTAAPVLLDSGVIHPTNLDVYYGSIAVNPLGQAVIGFSGSGPGDFVSTYAVAGTLTGDDLEFGDPILLKAGVGPYDVEVRFGAGSWGDYSATTFDPTDPTHFWTIQEWASGRSESDIDSWATQITEVIFGTPPEQPPGEPGPIDWDAIPARVTQNFIETGQWFYS